MKDHKKTLKPVRLQTQVYIFSIVLSALILILSVTVGISRYIFHSFSTLKKETRHEFAYMLKNSDRSYIDRLFKDTKKLYYKHADSYSSGDCNPAGKDSEKRQEYRELFTPLMDKDYQKLHRQLSMLSESTDMADIALIFIDRARGRVVLVADGADDSRYHQTPGMWMTQNSSGTPDQQTIDRIAGSSYMLYINEWATMNLIVRDYQAVTDSRGEQIGYFIAMWDISELMIQVRNFFAISLPAIFLIVFFLSRFVNRFMTRTIVSPILELSDAAGEYSRIEASDIERSDPVFSNINIQSPIELAELLTAMKNMEGAMAHNITVIRDITAAREKYEADLSVAREIQMSLLPKVSGDIASSDTFQVFGRMRPARVVGGDFYDFFMPGPDHLLFLAADVSDKGAGAALFMGVSRAMIRARAMIGGSPAQILYDVNNLIDEFNDQSMFVTVWMGLLDLNTGKVEFTNAGHEYPVLCRHRPSSDMKYSYEFIKDAHGLPMAMMPGLDFSEGEVFLNPGDRIVLYTDGITDAHNEDDEMFEAERLIDILSSADGGSIEDICREVWDRVEQFSGSAAQFDDMTLLGLEYTPS